MLSTDDGWHDAVAPLDRIGDPVAVLDAVAARSDRRPLEDPPLIAAQLAEGGWFGFPLDDGTPAPSGSSEAGMKVRIRSHGESGFGECEIWQDGVLRWSGVDRAALLAPRPLVPLLSTLDAHPAPVSPVDGERRVGELADLLRRMRDWCLSGDEPDAPDGTPTLLDAVNRALAAADRGGERT